MGLGGGPAENCRLQTSGYDLMGDSSFPISCKGALETVYGKRIFTAILTARDT